MAARKTCHDDRKDVWVCHYDKKNCAYKMHTSALMGTLIGITNTKTCSCLDEFSASVYMHLKITADSLYIVFYTKVFFFFFIP